MQAHQRIYIGTQLQFDRSLSTGQVAVGVDPMTTGRTTCSLLNQHQGGNRQTKDLLVVALLAIATIPTVTFAQEDRVRIEASQGSGRYDNVMWSALSCHSPPCAANQSLDTTGNGKPYLLQIDQCNSKIEAWEGNGELIPKGVKMIGFRDCTLFFAEGDSSVGREILRTCPIGSRCHIETSIQGDSGIQFIVNIERIK